MRRSIRAIAAGAAFVLLFRNGPASANPSCPASISSCGCTITSGGYYAVVSDLTAGSSGDCLDIKAAGVTLWLDGHSIEGNGSGVGLHLLKSARNNFIEGLDLNSGAFADLDGFGVGLEDDANNAIISHTNFDDNAEAGILLNKVSGSLVSDFAARSNAYGVQLSGASSCSIQRVSLDGNSIYGVWFYQSSGNVLNFFEAQDNLVAGVYVGCQSSAGPVGGRCKASNKNHIYDGPQVGPATASQQYGVAIDSGNRGNVLSGIMAAGDSTTDLLDQNPGCGSDLWFNNSGSNDSSCIH